MTGRRINWSLWIGALLVGFMTFLALWGPAFAPQDPMQENYTLKVDGKIRVPPYPAFEVPGYTLGTDRYGRDLLSRLLWAVRPTMIMVTMVAGVRLGLGLLLGMWIGWSEGRRGRILDSLLSITLSIPVLIAALIGMFIVGVDRGLWAFIFGLGLTGWAETARMVSEQTRMIKGQTFVEAARGLGASDRRILFTHVLRQIMSLLWVLLAFEISSTLLVSAELGFLGYYIGGGVWIEISDFNAVNVEGLPELGQMISSSLIKITDPSTLIIVGSVIGIGVLGFNLLGEGLRVQLSQEWLRGSRRFLFLSQAGQEWVEDHILRPFTVWIEVHRKALILSALTLIVISAAWISYDTISVRTLAPAEVPTQSTNADLQPQWASDRGDAQGSMWTAASLNAAPVLAWSLPFNAAGRPSVGADGTLYVSTAEKKLLAVSADGVQLWESALDEIAIGAPALGLDGRVIVADYKGFITSFDSNGNRLWRTQASSGRAATSGPIVDSSGNVYVTTVDTVAALGADGAFLWRTQAAEVYLEEPPRLSPDESMIFLKNSVIRAADGTLIPISLAPPQELLFTDPSFFSGANGKNYYRLGHEILGWSLNGSGEAEVDTRQTWTHEGTVLLLPFDQGVTGSGLTWFYYTMFGQETRMIWLDADSRVVGNYAFRNPNPRLIALTEKGDAVLCGSVTVKVNCINIAPGAEEPAWDISVESPAPLLGGAVVPGRLYLLLGDGLYALDSQETQP